MSDSEEETTEKQLKVTFIGDTSVGKTSLIKRYCHGEFNRQYIPTSGVDFFLQRTLLPGQKQITLKIFDVGGEALVGNMLDKYIFNSNVIILVYDITNLNSFESLVEWLGTIHQVVSDQKPTMAVFGNKCDSEHQRAIRLDRIQKFCKENGLTQCTVSARTGEAVAASIVNLVACNLGIKLTKAQQEQQMTVVKAEIEPRYMLPNVPVAGSALKAPKPDKNSFVCIIEKYTDNVRFCIICNYLSKIIPALQSRCTRFRFGPLNNDQIVPRLDYVIEQEKLKVTDDGKEALLTLAQGDMRKVLNILQSTWLAYKSVDENNVYTCVGHPLKADIENIVKWLLTEDFDKTYKNIKNLKTLKGLALADIITEIHTYIQRVEFPSEVFISLLAKLADIECRLASGTNENIQLTSLIAAFRIAVDAVPSPDDNIE